MAKKDKLEEVEGRFYSWTHLSDQQEEDITWLINTLKKIKYECEVSDDPIVTKGIEDLIYGS